MLLWGFFVYISIWHKYCTKIKYQVNKQIKVQKYLNSYGYEEISPRKGVQLSDTASKNDSFSSLSTMKVRHMIW